MFITASAFASQGFLGNFDFWSLLDLLYNEDFVLVELLVHWELSSLSESLSATFVWALEWLLTGVYISVFFQVLGKSKFLETNHTHKLFCWLMGCDVSSQWKSCGKLLIAVWVVAFVWSFHFLLMFLLVRKVSYCCLLQVLNFITIVMFKYLDCNFIWI